MAYLGSYGGEKGKEEKSEQWIDPIRSKKRMKEKG